MEYYYILLGSAVFQRLILLWGLWDVYERLDFKMLFMLFWRLILKCRAVSLNSVPNSDGVKDQIEMWIDVLSRFEFFFWWINYEITIHKLYFYQTSKLSVSATSELQS